MLGGDVGKYRVFQHFAVGQGHVRGDGDALILEVGSQFGVLQVGAELDLVGGDFAFADHLDGLAGEFDIEV
ncbi:hypothetical protein D3C79_926570 [compost metagenome]